MAKNLIVRICSHTFYSKKVQSELSAAEEALAKKKRKMVPGKPGQGTLGRRPSGTSTNGTT
jgi:hypothetical protein